jgi:hypothetical protein
MNIRVARRNPVQRRSETKRGVKIGGPLAPGLGMREIRNG